VNLQNWRFHITGIVQGVGFRPTVYLLAQDHHLTGWVINTTQGVEIEIHGSEQDCAAFTQRLRDKPPALSKVDSFVFFPAPLQVFEEFTIRESENRPEDFLPVSPDLAICPDCKAELFNPDDRRYRYPFINCTHCGPRFSIVRDIPYDRANTSMASFPLCPDCAAEYHNPANRRFHAQPVACPVCGPQIWYEQAGLRTCTGEQALQTARGNLREGKILAVRAWAASIWPATHTMRLRFKRCGNANTGPANLSL